MFLNFFHNRILISTTHARVLGTYIIPWYWNAFPSLSTIIWALYDLNKKPFPWRFMFSTNLWRQIIRFFFSIVPIRIKFNRYFFILSENDQIIIYSAINEFLFLYFFSRTFYYVRYIIHRNILYLLYYNISYLCCMCIKLAIVVPHRDYHPVSNIFINFRAALDRARHCVV